MSGGAPLLPVCSILGTCVRSLLNVINGHYALRRKSIVGRAACRRLSTKALLKARFRYPIQAKTSKPLQPEHKLLHCLGVGSKIRAKSRSVMAPSPCGWHPHVASRRSLIASQFPSRSFALYLDSRARRRTRKSMPWRTISETKLQEVVVRSYVVL